MSAVHVALDRVGSKWWGKEGKPYRLKATQKVPEAFAMRGPKQITEDGWLNYEGCHDLSVLLADEFKRRGISVRYMLAVRESAEQGGSRHHVFLKVYDRGSKRWKVIDPKWFTHPHMGKVVFSEPRGKVEDVGPFFGVKPTTMRRWAKMGIGPSSVSDDKEHYLRLSGDGPAGYWVVPKELSNIKDINAFLAKKKKDHHATLMQTRRGLLKRFSDDEGNK